MAWVSPQYTREAVNKAGRVLVSASAEEGEENEEAFAIISNWRSSHSFPLNTFKIRLIDYAHGVNPKALVAQRLKRLSSIAEKLRRFPTMKLSAMQDIAGCR